jgi:lipoprotein-anchoring transpeptidase ErfK/SrfK
MYLILLRDMGSTGTHGERWGKSMRFGFASVAFAIALLVETASASAADVLISISKAKQKMTVSVDGETLYVWPVSTGAKGYSTPSGTFTPFRLEKDHFSKEWDDAPMPHSIFFTAEGHAIHGSLYTKSLGRRASHGCVRLAPPNAAKLFALVKKQGLRNTTVEVRGGPEFLFSDIKGFFR